MKRRIAAVSCSVWLVLGCGAEDSADTPLDPVTIDECEGLPQLTLALSGQQVRVQSALTLHAAGGSGRYRYALEPGGSGGELRDNRLITGTTPATDRVSASDDCGHSASASVEVRGAFEVSPARAELRPGTRFQLEVSGNLGEVVCEAQTLGSGGSLSDDCAYVAGEKPGLDVIGVRDQGSGDQVAVQYQVKADAALRGVPERLALPRDASLTLHTTGGSDAVVYRLLQGPGKLDGASYTASMGAGEAERLALIEAEDPFTRERARIVVQILEELGGSDKPHGRLTDQASLATGDFDGDGIEDVALGVPESDVAKPGGGAVFVWKGSAEGLAKQPTWTLTGQSDTASLGAVLAAGDLDGDGRAELAISSPGADITVADSGAVLIYTWGAQGPALLRPALTGTGPSKFGASLAIADVDADGVRDLLVGSPNADLAPSASVKERGVVDVFLLRKGVSIPDYASLRIGGSNLTAEGKLGTGSGLRFGRAIAVGDFNGDGRADLASLGAVDHAAVGGMDVAKNQVAVALHFGRAASPPFAAAPDLYIAPWNAADGSEGTYRLFTGPAVDGGAQRLLVAADKLDAPDLSARGGMKALSDAGGVYVYDLSDHQVSGEPAPQPTQLGRDAAFARIYGDVASGAAARSVTFADLDGDAALDLVLGAPLAARPGADKAPSAALTGKLLAYPYQTLGEGSVLNVPVATRWGRAQAETFGVALSTWSPNEQPGLLVLAGRASTELGDFTGRLDAYLGDLRSADLSPQSAALPARLASQQRGAAVALTRSGPELQALVGVPGYSGPGSRGDGDDQGAGRALLFTPGAELRVVHEGAASAHSKSGLAAYGGRSIGSDVAVTDFDGDGRQDLVVAAPQLSTPTAASTEYAALDMGCVTASPQGNGGALVFVGQPDGSYAPGYRVFAVADIAGCTPAGDAKCKRRELARYGIAGGFDFDGDGKGDLLLSRANGLEVFLGRTRVASDKPSMACNPVFSLPALAQPVSAPSALGDLDADGCDEIALRYADGSRSGLVIAFGFSSSGGCKGHAQPAWLRIAGDGEVGMTNMQLGIASARAGKVFADARDMVAISAGLYPFEGTRQPAVLLFDAKQLAAKRPMSGEVVISALDPGLSHSPLLYRERATGFGRALAGSVDLDGDGVVDLVVSAPGASINGDGSGAVFAFRGAAAFGGRMDPWLSVLGDPKERGSVGQDLSVIAAKGDSPASLAIGAPLSYRTGTANGTAWLLQLTAAP